MKVSDYVMKFISDLGVKQVFLLPGGGCMHLVDSLGKSSLKPICCLHEQSAVIMADADAQYTNNIGVALVTTGPGSTNAITGVAASWIDSVPLLVISGQTKTTDMIKNSRLRQKGIQEVDIVSIVEPITKFAHTVIVPDDIKHYLKKAVHIAKSGRQGPVWIDIPLDVQGATINESELVDFVPFKYYSSPKIDDIIKLIESSCRPVILAGNGIRLANAETEFLELINILNIPVLTTWKAADLIPENHPLYFGRPGSIASRYANFIQQTADLIICIGTRLDLPQVGFNYDNFAPKAKRVIVDIDRYEINKLKFDISVCCDAKVFITDVMNKALRKNVPDWLSQCKTWKNKYPIILPEYLLDSHTVNPYALIDTLSDILTPTDIIVPGSSGACSEITMQAFRIKDGQRMFNSPGLGSMGFGLPASIGACISSGRRTISIIGDGGLQHNIQELETLRRLNLPVKLFIMDNGGYGSIKTTQTRHFNSHFVCCNPESGLTFPDIERIANAYQIKFIPIVNQIRLKEQIKDVLDGDYPVICNVSINPDIETQPKLSSKVLSDGSIVSGLMDDLYPFLSKKYEHE